MEHGSPKISNTLQDQNVMLAKKLKQTEGYYKRMVDQRDTATHKLNIVENRNKELRFKFVAENKKVRRLDEKIFELKMKNADMVLALNKAEKKNKALTTKGKTLTTLKMKNADLLVALNEAEKKNKHLAAQITDLFDTGEESLDIPTDSHPADISMSSESQTDSESHPVSPPSSPIPKPTGQLIKKENGTPEKPRKPKRADEKPRKRTLADTQTSSHRRRSSRSSQRLKIQQKWTHFYPDLCRCC